MKKIEPKSELSSFQTKEDVYKCADEFLNCAKFSISNAGYNDFGAINASLVNCCLSLELYLKSHFLKRKSIPYKLTEDEKRRNAEIVGANINDNNEIEVVLSHKILCLDESKLKTHDLYSIFEFYPNNFKDKVYNEILSESEINLKDKNIINKFFKKISKHFIDKRYQFEQFYISNLGDYNDAKLLIEITAVMIPIIINYNNTEAA